MSKTNKKKFQEEEMPHELFLTTRQTKLRNVFAKNMPT